MAGGIAAKLGYDPRIKKIFMIATINPSMTVQNLKPLLFEEKLFLLEQKCFLKVETCYKLFLIKANGLIC